MKSLIYSLLTLSFIFSLGACGDNGGGKREKITTNRTNPTNPAAETANADGNTAGEQADGNTNDTSVVSDPTQDGTIVRAPVDSNPTNEALINQAIQAVDTFTKFPYLAISANDVLNANYQLEKVITKVVKVNEVDTLVLHELTTPGTINTATDNKIAFDKIELAAGAEATSVILEMPTQLQINSPEMIPDNYSRYSVESKHGQEVEILTSGNVADFDHAITMSTIFDKLDEVILDDSVNELPGFTFEIENFEVGGNFSHSADRSRVALTLHFESEATNMVSSFIIVFKKNTAPVTQ